MKHLSKIAFAIILSLVFFACSESKENNDIIASRLTASEMDFIGKEHNAILARSLDFLKDQAELLSKLKGPDKKNLLLDFIVEDVKAIKKYPKEYIEIGIKQTKKAFNNYSTNKSQEIENTIFSDFESFLSEKELNYLTLLNSILEQENSEGNTIREDIANLEQIVENDNELNNTQLFVIFSATSMAKNSFKYWDENIEEWANIESEEHRKFYNFSQKNDDNDGHNGCLCANASSIARADVTGAIGAAVGAAAANVIVGPGTVAYGSAIVTGAVGNSAIEAVSQIFDWLGW